MKQISLSLITIFALLACSSDDAQEPAAINNPIKQSEIVGVWTDGDYFVSFNNDGFYSAYIADNYIDCGDYTIQFPSNDNDEIKGDYFFDGHLLGITGNSHFTTLDKHTYFTIDEITKTTIKLTASFTITQPYSNISTTLSLTKTDDLPTQKNHHIIGYSFSEQCDIDGKNATVNTNLSTYNTGWQTTDYEEAVNFPIELQYVYLGNTIYYQKIIPNRQLEALPIWYGWNDDTTGKVYTHTFTER